MKFLPEKWKKFINESNENNDNAYFIIGFVHTVSPRAERQKLMKTLYDFIHKRKVPKWAGKVLAQSKEKGDFRKFVEKGKKWTVMKMEGETRTQTSRGTIKKPTVKYEWEQK